MDVQLYMFINGAWQEYNPKPAAHDHTISDVTGLQTQLNSKLNLSGGAMTGPITMGSNNITGNNSSIFQAGRIIATNSNTNDHGITSKGTRANMLYLMDGATGGLAASLLDVDVKNTTTPQKRIAKIGIFGSATSGTGGTPSANYLWLSAVDGNTYNVDATLKVDAENRVGIALAGSGRPTQALDVEGKIRMRTATVDSDGADTVVTKGYMLGKIVSDTNNYLSSVTGSGNGTVTFNRQGLLSLTWDATHDHNSLYNTKTEITSLLAGKQSTINGAASTITSTNLLADRALISSSTGKVVVSDVTSTELGYLDGVTSSIQTQLSNKVDKVSGKGLSTNDYTSTEKTKLAGIEAGAEVNVQADWNEATSSSDAFIKNKPTITNNYLTNVTGSGNGTITFTRQGLLALTLDATHSHGKAEITNFDNEVLSLFPAWAKASTKPGYNLGEIDDTLTYKKVSQVEKNTWNAKQDALGYTPESAANKRTSIRSSGANDTSYVSELGVKTYVDGLIGSVYRPAGDWNANTNAPALANNTPANAGKVYRVSVAGTRFGFTFAVGDKLAFNESGVISKWDNVDDVVSVNGQTGTVVLTTDNISQGSNLYVSESEKTTWHGKQSAINGAASTITSSNLTTNRALISNGSGKVAVSAVTSTELGYLDGVTSSIQTQLSNKVDKVSGKVLSTNDYTTNEKNKLAGIASGAEVNVQADWTETNTGSDAFIKNKPTITNNYLTNVTGSGNGTITFTRQGLLALTLDATHSHGKAEITNFDNEVLSLFPAWAKASTKPGYNLGEIDDTLTYKKVTAAEKITWNNKQDALGYTPTSWTLIKNTATTISSTTGSSVTVPSGNYYGKTIAIEISVGSSSATYNKTIIFVTLGSLTTNTASSSYIRNNASFTSFDGRYLNTISFRARASNSTVNYIYLENLKTLSGSFSGTEILWETSVTSLSVYNTRIWLVE